VSDVFGGAYAGAYDALYGDKDYEGECDLIESLFAEYGSGPVRSVLDLGCGTGGHALLLSARGYEVVGVERSPQMLALARVKAGGAVELHEGDIRSLELGRELDAALMMFAVLGYQLEDADVLDALASARRHLRPGGLLLFDVWYGPAVLSQRPSERVKTIDAAGVRIERTASGELDAAARICTVTFRVRRFEGDRLAVETEERHRMRFFFPRELAVLLEQSGLELVRLGAFPEPEREPDESTWNALAVARRL
jgi:SAM-dependent methyltransferase